LNGCRVGFNVPEVDGPADGAAVDDDVIIDRLRRGDPTAFDEVYRRFTPGLFGFLVRLTGQTAIAEELLQETWLRFATHARALAPAANLRAWLFTVARNLYRSHRRRGLVDLARLRFWRGSADACPGPASPHDLVVASQTERQLERALSALPLEQREILLLVALEGFSPAQAAAITGVRPAAARQRLHRARTLIGEALETAWLIRVPKGET
jgi:RNA polymerase sigma-70 factor (ECF subfamily)